MRKKGLWMLCICLCVCMTGCKSNKKEDATKDPAVTVTDAGGESGSGEDDTEDEDEQEPQTIGHGVEKATDVEKAFLVELEHMMQAAYHNNSEGYSSSEYGEELYNSGMEYFADMLMYYMEVEEEYLKDETKAEFVEIAKKLSAKATWKVTGIELKGTDTGAEGQLQIEITPTDYLYLVQEPVEEVINTYNEKYEDVDFDNCSEEELGKIEQDYAEMVLKALEGLVEQTQAGDTIVKTFTVTKGELSDEQWAEIDNCIIDMDDLFEDDEFEDGDVIDIGDLEDLEDLDIDLEDLDIDLEE